MSELWRQLMTDESRKLSGLLSLKEVNLSRSTGDMEINFCASRIFTQRECELVSNAMQNGFPKRYVEVKISYPDLRQSALEDINRYKLTIIDKLIAESPSCAWQLNGLSGAWKIEGDVLKIEIPSAQSVRFLKLRKADEMIQENLRQMFGLRLGVSFVCAGDEAALIEQINKRHMEEEEELRHAAIENAADSSDKPQVGSKAILGSEFSADEVRVCDIGEDAGKVCVLGEIISFELKDTKKEDSKILSLNLTDYTSTISCKAFVRPKRGKNAPGFAEQLDNVKKYVKEGAWVKLQGEYRYDDFDRRYQIIISNMLPAQKPVRRDKAVKKRVELHMHTTMSAMDACATPTQLIEQAAQWGHSAVAITDHGVVQAFPEAFTAAKANKIKLIPGCEAYLIDDSPEIVSNADDRPLKGATYVVLDVETTGLNTYTDRIIEIGAVRIENGVETARYSQLIDPEMPLPEKVQQLTGINSASLRGQPRIEDVIKEFDEFCKGSVIVAHNAKFDTAFFRRAYEDNGLTYDYPVLDTLALCRNHYRSMKTHKLGQICKELGIELKGAHRAVNDAAATAQVLLKTLKSLSDEKQLKNLNDLNDCFATDPGGDSRHIILLATSREGMTNLNRMVSDSHLKYFHRTPRMPRSLIQKHRKDIIVGSACEQGELYRAILAGKTEKELERIADFYDYLEIQPIGNNAFLLLEGAVSSEDELRDINRRILALGRKLGKPVVATGDVHFLNPMDSVYRAIIMASKGFDDADRQPPLYFKTTDEMLKEFEYLGRDDAKYVVVDAPNEIADRVEQIDDLFMRAPDGGETFQPFWEDAEENLRRLCSENAEKIFGSPLPEIVQARLDKELNSICGYGFSTLYMIAVKLVKKSMGDGYIVGSRGSVGSSFVAKLAGITEVDALPPYYVCPRCKHSEFDVPKEYTCGLDLPAKKCPVCGEEMNRDGFNIPFEVFLGFKGDKVPDIDLNFSGIYQPTAHQYVKELFGEENVFRAGTISTVADKTAYGYVLKYAEERGLSLPQAEKERLAKGITGIKRTTGQHPAGMVVLPKDYDINQFTAVQHPADDTGSDTVTTHFDFRSMHDVLVKLDILGHDDPTMLRNLQDLTGIKPQDVPLGDAKIFSSIISLFTTPEALGISAEELGSPTGTLGIPEFGTQFVRGMLMDTKPASMEELIRISGLSHGTAVWLGNIQDLLKAGITDLKHAICTRDDIMNQLMGYGVAPKMSFDIMELVRKGKAAVAKGKDLKPEMLEAMQQANVPDWFIGACRKIEYMFPKAHAVAYVTMALRIAYFKIYYPVAYYACFLWRNAESFDASTMICSTETLRTMMKRIDDMDKSENERNQDKYSLMESLVEMNLRGISLLPIDLYKSDPEKFIVVDDTHILPPLSSLPGLGLNAAMNLAAVREQGRFVSREDMVRRKIGKAVVETLASAGCLDDIPMSGQVSLFEF